MHYIFRCQKSTFNLENNKCVCQGNCFAYHVTGSRIFYTRILLQNYFPSYAYLKDIYKTEKNWKKSSCIRVNYFAKSVNF